MAEAKNTSRYVHPSKIFGEQLTYKNVILDHLKHMSSVLCEKPDVTQAGTISDHRILSFYFLVRLLHSWLVVYSGDTNYADYVVKNNFLGMAFPHPNDMRENFKFVAKLFQWHDKQATLFPVLDIYPKIFDSKPQEMSSFVATPAETEEEKALDLKDEDTGMNYGDDPTSDIVVET